MPSPFSDDAHLLLVTLAVTVVFQLAFFVVAFSCKFDKVRSQLMLLIVSLSLWLLCVNILFPQTKFTE